MSPTLIRYGVIGVVGLGVNLVLFWILYNLLDVHYLVANVISDIFAITQNFLLNAFFNFKTRDALLRRFAIYGSAWLAGLAFTTLILWLGVAKLELNPLIVKILATMMVVIAQYIFNAKVTFRKS